MAALDSPKWALVPQAGGLLASFTLYGLLQENIMTGMYNGAQFRSSVILVACNRLVGIIVAVYMQTRHLGNNLAPRQPLYAYAAVSVLNFLSTVCQYESLRHVNFTTQTLGKCSKIVPVLVLGVVLYGRRYPRKTYAAVGLIILGMVLYVMTSDIIARRNQGASTFKGILLLLGYLVFDGLVSTTEERLFRRPGTAHGRASRTTMDKKAKSELVYDQMLWINMSSLAISAVMLTIDPERPITTFVHHLISPDGPRLLLHISLLSLSASIGLIFLLTIIATYGALTCSTLMTGRQFISIVLNGVAFGSARQIGVGGWVGIGYVASGVWLELSNKRHRKQKLDEEDVGKGEEVPRGTRISLSMRSPIVLHIVTPLAGGVLLRLLPLLLLWGPAPQPVQRTPRLYKRAALTPAFELATESFIYRGTWYSRQDIAEIKAATICPPLLKRQFYPGLLPRTALASFPRSGNTFSRELVEHSTGWFSTNVMCGKREEPAYLDAACEQPDNNFLVKTHDPEIFVYPDMNETWRVETEVFERVILVTRNPVDSFWSFFHLLRHQSNHTAREEGIEQIDLHYFSEIDRMAQAWNQHTDYWLDRNIPRQVIRYEDLRGPDQVQHVGRMITLLLPPSELPKIEALVCADRDDAGSIAYKSAKPVPFSAWNRFTDEIREHILESVGENWCRLGFEDLLRAYRPGTVGVDCSQVSPG